jgi:hypothetical protein
VLAKGPRPPLRHPSGASEGPGKSHRPPFYDTTRRGRRHDRRFGACPKPYPRLRSAVWSLVARTRAKRHGHLTGPEPGPYLVRGTRRNEGPPRIVTDTDPAAHGPSCQLDRWAVCRLQRRGRRFEPCHAHHQDPRSRRRPAALTGRQDRSGGAGAALGPQALTIRLRWLPMHVGRCDQDLGRAGAALAAGASFSHHAQVEASGRTVLACPATSRKPPPTKPAPEPSPLGSPIEPGRLRWLRGLPTAAFRHARRPPSPGRRAGQPGSCGLQVRRAV